MTDMPPGQGFARGTALALPGGHRAVERLEIGDRLLDAGGETRRVRWIGRLELSAKWLAARPEARPIRVRAGALGEGLPARDLVVAPATEIGVVLPNGLAATVPARLLRNETTVLRAPDGEAAALYEVELEGDGGVLAEAVPAGLRPPGYGSPAHALAMVRARAWVSARAGCLPGPLLGRIDAAERGLLYGWALDEARPWMRVALEIVVNGQPVTAILAANRREDLVRAGIGDGCCSFHFEPEPPLPADRALLVQVRRADDATDLPGSPVLLEAGGGAAQILAALAPQTVAEGEEVRAALRAALGRLPRPAKS